jgi:hypothetical protein
MSGGGTEKTGSDSGFALAVVLAFLLLSAAFTIPFLTGAKIQSLVTRNTGQFAREKVALRGLIELAGTRFFERYQNRDISPVTAVRCRAEGPGGAAVYFHLQDHSGLIDLNAASAEVLAFGFESLAIERGEAARLGMEAVRFRSVDDGQRSGNERELPQGRYKHALFERTIELHDVLGGVNIEQEEIDRVFTVHSGTGTVDEAAAQGGLSARLVALKEAERFFVVSDVRRGGALTVKVDLTYANRRTVFGSSVLAPGERSGRARFLEPLSFGSAKTTAQSATEPVSECGAFFDPALLEAIGSVTS